MRKQEIRSEQTRRDILAAAGTLFSSKGYQAVTLREIAKEAGISHTTIYIYFKDKIELLQILAIPYLTELDDQLRSILEDTRSDSLLRLTFMAQAFFTFALKNRSMYTIILEEKAERVDESDPQLEINKLRNAVFNDLSTSFQQNFPATDKESIKNYTRIFFYTLNGMIHTYLLNEEPVEELLSRLIPILHTAIKVTVFGIKQMEGENE